MWIFVWTLAHIFSSNNVLHEAPDCHLQGIHKIDTKIQNYEVSIETMFKNRRKKQYKRPNAKLWLKKNVLRILEPWKVAKLQGIREIGAIDGNHIKSGKKQKKIGKKTPKNAKL